MLAYVIERVSGEAYGAFLQRNLFARAGMTSSGDRDDQDVVPGLATGYRPWIGTARIGRAQLSSVANARGPASLSSTVGDLHRWNVALHSGRILGPAALAKMLDATMPLGTGIATRHERKIIGHNGVWNGYTSFLQWHPADELSIVYAGNIESGVSVDVLEEAVTAIVLGEPAAAAPAHPAPVPMDRAELPSFTGDYTSGPMTLFVRIVRGELMLGAGDGLFPLELVGKDEFFYPLKYSRVTFVRDAAGAIASLRWSESGGSFDFPRAQR